LKYGLKRKRKNLDKKVEKSGYNMEIETQVFSTMPSKIELPKIQSEAC